MRRRGSSLDQSGFSLVELMVTIVLLGIVLSAVVALASTVGRVHAHATGTLDDLADGRSAMETVTKHLRAAAAPTGADASFVQGDGDEAVFFSNVGNTTSPDPDLAPPIKIAYEVRGVGGERRLVETVTQPDPGTGDPTYSGAAGQRERVLARPLVAGPSVFRYFDTGGDEIGAGGLATGQLNEVAGVEVRLLVRSPLLGADETTVLSNRVRVSNRYYVDGGS